jgi:hypothetical protein
VRIFKTQPFCRFVSKWSIHDAALRAAVAQIDRGLADAELGGGVFKQRIAREAGGKSGGFRVVVFYKPTRFALFVYGFSKNARDNITVPELRDFKRLAKVVLAYDDSAIDKAVKNAAFVEIAPDEEKA